MGEEVRHAPQQTEPYKETTFTEDDCIVRTVHENHCSEYQTSNSTTRYFNQLKWKWKNIVTVVCLWFTYLSYNANYSLIGALFPNEAIAKGCSSTITGVIISASPFCVVLLSPLVGYFLSHVGLRTTLLAGIFLVGGAFTLQGFLEWMPSRWVFITFGVLLRMTEGVGSAMFITALFTLLPELYPAKVGLIKGLFEVAGGIGFSIGPPIGGILYNGGGLKLPFVVFGVSTLVLAILSLLFVRHSSTSYNVKPPLSLKLIRKLVSTFIIFNLLIAHVLSQAAMSFFSPILQPFLTNEFQLNPSSIGLIFLCASVTYMVVSLLVGPISDLVGQRYFIIFGFFLFGFGYFFIGPADFITSPQLWITCISYVLIGIGAAFGIVPFYAHVLAISKKELYRDPDQDSETLTGVISGLVSFTVSLGHFVGPLVGGALKQFFNFQTSALLVGEFLLAECLLLLGITLIVLLTI